MVIFVSFYRLTPLPIYCQCDCTNGVGPLRETTMMTADEADDLITEHGTRGVSRMMGWAHHTDPKPYGPPAPRTAFNLPPYKQASVDEAMAQINRVFGKHL